jgi:hypothetical protein
MQLLVGQHPVPDFEHILVGHKQTTRLQPRNDKSNVCKKQQGQNHDQQTYTHEHHIPNWLSNADEELNAQSTERHAE